MSDIGPNAYGVVETRIAGGRCAALRLVGSDDGLAPAPTWLADFWLALCWLPARAGTTCTSR